MRTPFTVKVVTASDAGQRTWHGYPVLATEGELLALRAQLVGRRASNWSIVEVSWEADAGPWSFAKVLAEYASFE